MMFSMNFNELSNSLLYKNKYKTVKHIKIL